MSWAGSDRRERLPDDWGKICRLVRQRAGGRCEKRLPSLNRCPRPGTDVDHIIAGDDHRLTNLQLLCRFHHNQKSSREGLAARMTKKALGTRPKPPHPGKKTR